MLGTLAKIAWSTGMHAEVLSHRIVGIEKPTVGIA